MTIWEEYDMTSDERRELWRERIAACRASGLSISTWCEAHGVTQSSFYRWKKLLSEAVGETPPSNTQSQSGWLRLMVSDEAENDQGRITLRVGAVCVDVLPGFNSKLLREVVRTLVG